MNYTILDCYTDEASGLGVPPYIGTYPRYLYGHLKNKANVVNYITIDDLRYLKIYNNIRKEVTKKDKTNIRIHNLTRDDISPILEKTDVLFVNLGVHVPGKYLTAVPGTLKEVIPLIKDIRCKKILTGPAYFGTQLEGGKFSEKTDMSIFNEKKWFNFSFKDLKKISIDGVDIIKQIKNYKIIEIETGVGCNVGKCSFCTEPIKNRFLNRPKEDILKEIKAYYDLGARYFRMGKQADFYSIDEPIWLLKNIRSQCPDIKVLHIDNTNPVFVVKKGGDEITKAIVKYCSSGNVGAFGVESFDPEVVRANTLNSAPKISMRAIEILNKYGSERGDNGMPKFLPGINIIFGLNKESKKTHECNMEALKKIMDCGLMLRRINIRQTALLEDTPLTKTVGNKFLKKNKKYYWKWRNDIRQNIDNPLLKRLLPKGTVLKDCIAEIYDGNTTFLRQIGTYPLIIGVKGRVELGKFYNLKIIDYMLRSVVGEVV
ncbi:radical SAM protein [archaeon]|jgi:radical SAM superfamily enzyme with C-terminal helix-hairpin-helix motif|nr:radical SAM protein [archaeon]MBT4352641.1 radical SAM protein [archaeon]MBT4647231.1 radical SAM protein [archaeon]MBT5492212.1 radical SAM protein [bacterium]MBT7391461.1 radical SAM protein [archaeon]